MRPASSGADAVDAQIVVGEVVAARDRGEPITNGTKSAPSVGKSGIVVMKAVVVAVALIRLDHPMLDLQIEPGDDWMSG
jgi:hypothetical protein